MTVSCAAVAAMACACSAQHEHDDLVVGVTGGGVLSVEGDFDEAHYLPPFSDGGINGWFSDDPGFESLEEDEPDEDFYMLESGADVYFELIAVDPAFKMYDPSFTLLVAGDTFAFGGHEFHEHPFWHIDSDDPRSTRTRRCGT
jgi:hypothetical protein